MSEKILAINPGSTSTKLALFDGFDEKFTISIDHDIQEIKKFNKIIEQKDFRLKYIKKFLEEKNIKLTELNAVVGRGGLLKSIPGGTYKVNKKMLEDLRKAERGEHASNLGAILAHTIANEANCPSFIVDPVVVDELDSRARLSGMPELKRRSIFHALNQKSVAREYAHEHNKKYEDITVIVAHLGGGISVGIHRDAKVIDVNNALSGEGAFSPNRSGGLAAIDLLELIHSGDFTYKELKNKLIGDGGVVAYLGTNDMREVEKRVKKGDNMAKLVLDSMIYQVSKQIGELSPVAAGKIDAIILTGGIAYSEYFTKKVKEMVDFIAPIVIYPGEEELEALASGAYRVISNKEKAKEYV